MSIVSAQNRFTDLLTGVGRAVLHQQFPDEFEYYMLTLELVNPSTGKTEEMFVFPVMPEEMRIREAQITNIRKTAGGISVLTNPTYVSKEVSVSGSFGRKFRFIIGNQLANFGAAFNYQSALAEAKKLKFDKNIKTGYGITKTLMEFLEKARGTTPEGTPYQLFLYNAAYNDNHLVECIEKSVNQDMSTNMVWRYNLAFKTVAPADQIRNVPSGEILQNQMVFDLLQKGLTTGLTVAKEQAKLLRNVVFSSNIVTNTENIVASFINK